MKLFSTICLLLVLCCGASGQTPVDSLAADNTTHGYSRNARQHVKQGNRLFRNQQLDEAETAYRKALDSDASNSQALFNIGNTLMLQRKDSLAVTYFEKAAAAEQNPIRRAQAYHNMGYIAQAHQLYGEAIEAYKQALRLNPNDDDTRYNLVQCMKKQKDQPQNQGQKNQQNNQDKKEQQQEQQDQKKHDQQKQDQQDQQKQDQPEMSRDNVEQMLKAARQQEQQTQEKLKNQQRPTKRQLHEKNW